MQTLLSSVFETAAERDRFEEKCFQAWMTKVNLACVELFGLNVEDLDGHFRDWYEQGEPAIAAARRAVHLTRNREAF